MKTFVIYVCNIIIDKLSFSLHTSAIINCETFIPKHFQCMISYALFIERIIFTLHMLKDPQCFASKHTYTIYHSVVKCGYYDLSNNFYGKTHIWRYLFTTSVQNSTNNNIQTPDLLSHRLPESTFTPMGLKSQLYHSMEIVTL